MKSLTEEQLRAVVTLWGQHNGLPLNLVVKESVKGGATVDPRRLADKRGYATIHVDSQILHCSVQTQKTLLAHEAGHLFAKQYAARGRTITVSVLVGIAVAAVIASLINIWAGLFLLIPLLISMLVFLVSIDWLSRKDEYAADTWAATVAGFPYTLAFHEELMRHGLGDETQPRTLYERLSRSHPIPEQRASKVSHLRKNPNRTPN